MVNIFYAKFFQVREKVIVISLTKEIQTLGEDVVDYIKRFQDRAVDCTESVKEGQLDLHRKNDRRFQDAAY